MSFAGGLSESQIERLMPDAELQARKVIVHMGCRGEDVEDVLADARLKALTGKYDGRSSFATWLCKIAVNRWIDVRRRDNRRPFDYVAEYPEDLAPESDQGWSYIDEPVQEALQAASPAQLEAIGALYTHGDQRSAAESLRITDAALKGHVYRFRRKIGATRPYW